MRTPITYYGGKQMMAEQIINILPEHKIYCEPYFGGGAVFFAKPKSYLEVINDNNDKLITFYSILRDDFINLNRMISESVHSEKLHRIAKDIYNERSGTKSDLEMAWAVWMLTNGSFGGSIHGGWKWCNGTAGSHSGIYLRGKRDDVANAMYERIKEVQISCRDAVKVISDRDSEESVFYLDPPYPGSVQCHYSGFSMADLIQLLDLIQSIKGKFILSNFWSQTLKYYILKNNWHVMSFTSQMKVANLGSRQKKIKFKKSKTEILVMNFVPREDPQMKINY